MLDQAQLTVIATKLGVSTDAQRKWFERGLVPHRWRMPILQEAMKRGITADYSSLGELERNRKRRAA